MLCSVEEYCKVSRILEIGSRSNLKGRERCPNDQIISYSCVQTFLKQKVYINLLFQMTYPTVYSVSCETFQCFADFLLEFL